MYGKRALALIGIVACCSFGSPAAAVDKEMEMSANASANCQGALPNFEGSVRKRPLAVQNEGSSAAFVTCSFVNEYDIDDQRQISYYGAWFTNNGTSAATVSCTGVAGYETGSQNTFNSKSVVVAANAAAQAQIFFRPEDNGGNGYYPLVSLSCNLPPGVGINDTYTGYLFNDE